MNERIKLLAEQAESSRLEYNSATMMTERIQEFDKRKFAELIVRDCIDTLLWHGCDDAVPYIEYWAQEAIGQRLGVEE